MKKIIMRSVLKWKFLQNMFAMYKKIDVPKHGNGVLHIINIALNVLHLPAITFDELQSMLKEKHSSDFNDTNFFFRSEYLIDMNGFHFVCSFLTYRSCL